MRWPWKRPDRDDNAASRSRLRGITAPVADLVSQGPVQQVSLNRLDAGGDITTNITLITDARTAEEREIAEALIGDPLRLAGVDADVKRAKELRADGKQQEAGLTLVQVARELDQRGYGVVGEFSLEEAAEAFAEAGDATRAAVLTEEIIRRRLARVDGRAEFDARRLAKYLNEGAQWRAEGFTARTVWPEQPEAAVSALEEALKQVDGTSEELEWAAALVEILTTLGRFADARRYAEKVRGRYPDFVSANGPIDRDRLALELDYLDAKLEVDGAIKELDSAWDELIARLTQRQPALPPRDFAWVWQRRAVMLGRSDRPVEARAAYVQAIKEWNREAGNEEQIKEAFFSLERIALLSGTWRFETQPIRVYASRLRGTKESPTTLADRLERQGLHARLADKLPDARRSFWLAYAVSRVAGNFYEQTTCAELLAELHLAAERPLEAVRFLIEAGKEKEAARLAIELPGDGCLTVLRLHGPVWERTVSYAVLAEVGKRLADDEVAALVPMLLGVARSQSTTLMWPQPEVRARAALAAMVIAVPEEYLAEVSDLLVNDQRTPNADDALRALIVLTNVGRVDETARVTEILFDETSLLASSGPFISWLGERLVDYPDLHDQVRNKAVAGNNWALETMATAELVNDDEGLISKIDARIESFLGHRSYEEKVEDGKRVRTVHFGDNAGVGVTARFCSAELRSRLVDRLLEIVANDNEAEMSRASAASALYNLAGVISADEARRALPLLTRVGRGEHGHSDLEGATGRRDPFARFSIIWNVSDALRSAAIAAAARIASRVELTPTELADTRLAESLNLALESALGRTVAAALDGYAWLPEFELPLSFPEAFGHSDPEVRIATLRLFNARAALPPFADLAALASQEPDANVRAFFCLIAAEARAPGRSVAEALASDADAFVRWRARLQLATAALI